MRAISSDLRADARILEQNSYHALAERLNRYASALDAFVERLEVLERKARETNGCKHCDMARERIADAIKLAMEGK